MIVLVMAAVLMYLLKKERNYFSETEPYKYMNDEKSLLNQMIYERHKLMKQ